MARLEEQRTVQRNEVGRAAKRFEIDQLDAELTRAVGGDERIRSEQLQAPATQFSSDRAPNVAEANDAERLPGQPVNRVVAMNVPTPALHSFASGNDFSNAREEQRDGMRRNFVDAVGWYVADD